PGRDGVGDYTRRLAIEFIRLGHQVVLFAIHERRLSESMFDSVQDIGSIAVTAHRLSSKLSWKKRQLIVKQFVSQINPDIISLQFVSHSFHKKGIPYFLPKWLSKIASPLVKWHVMFHELWVTDSVHDSLKDWLLSKLQK